MKTTIEQDKSNVKLFDHPIMNMLAKAHYPSAIVGYPLVGLALFITGLYLTSIPWYQLLLAAVIGYFGWTLVEYILHRFIYHEIGGLKLIERFQYIFHGIHHDYPKKEDKLIMPPAPWLLTLALFFVLFYIPFGNYAFGIVPGLVWGYVSYVYIHYHIHLQKSPRWMRKNRMHHMLHHYRHHDKAYGVTTPIWDIVFSTMPPERVGWNR